jgi:hypothetical protein
MFICEARRENSTRERLQANRALGRNWKTKGRPQVPPDVFCRHKILCTAISRKSKTVRSCMNNGNIVKLHENSREIFTVVELNIRIRGNIFQIYSPISWKNFTFINTVRQE